VARPWQYFLLATVDRQVGPFEMPSVDQALHREAGGAKAPDWQIRRNFLRNLKGCPRNRDSRWDGGHLVELGARQSVSARTAGRRYELVETSSARVPKAWATATSMTDGRSSRSVRPAAASRASTDQNTNRLIGLAPRSIGVHSASSRDMPRAVSTSIAAEMSDAAAGRQHRLYVSERRGGEHG